MMIHGEKGGKGRLISSLPSTTSSALPETSRIVVYTTYKIVYIHTGEIKI